MIDLQSLKSHPVYDLCSKREQKFLQLYLTLSKDFIRAVQLTWPNEDNPAKMARKLQKNAMVSALVDLIDGETGMPSNEDLIKMANRAAQSTDNPYAIIKAVSVMAELKKQSQAGDKPADIRERLLKRAEELDKRS